MGLAWKANNQFPWETIRYEGGIENVKVNVTLRIFSAKWHVYAGSPLSVVFNSGLAIMNPSAQRQITQYAASVTGLFKLMTEGKEKEFYDRVHNAGRFVFGDQEDNRPRLLRDDLLDQFSLSGVPKAERVPNNQLALLSMVDCWWKLGLNPYDHMICSTPVSHTGTLLTPIFRLWLGITEYLYRQPGLLDECIQVAIQDNTFRRDDLEFTFAARVLPTYRTY
jgi:prephenate dehydrogenase (NADP+)